MIDRIRFIIKGLMDAAIQIIVTNCCENVCKLPAYVFHRPCYRGFFAPLILSMPSRSNARSIHSSGKSIKKQSFHNVVFETDAALDFFA